VCPAAADVRLVPHPDASSPAFLDGQVQAFAAQKVQAGHWLPRDAPALARLQFERVLPRGAGTPGHRFVLGLDASGARIGWAWTGPPVGAAPRDARWLYQIEVPESLRGRGWGRALLGAVERDLAADGVTELGLNVFKFNLAARALYARAGYLVVHEDPTSARLHKRFRP
jgi:ribosomal protein S18 acetylase RimI-like enzyme